MKNIPLVVDTRNNRTFKIQDALNLFCECSPELQKELIADAFATSEKAADERTRKLWLTMAKAYQKLHEDLEMTDVNPEKTASQKKREVMDRALIEFEIVQPARREQLIRSMVVNSVSATDKEIRSLWRTIVYACVSSEIEKIFEEEAQRYSFDDSTFDDSIFDDEVILEG